MSRPIRTGLGQVYELERHLPSLGWRPRYGSLEAVAEAVDTLIAAGTIRR